MWSEVTRVIETALLLDSKFQGLLDSVDDGIDDKLLRH